MGLKRVRVVSSANGCLRINVRSLTPMITSKSTGSDTGRRYRIHQGTTSNIWELDEEMEAKTGWCFVPERPLAACDVMLAQKIALETDEAAVIALANRVSPRLPSRPRMVRRAY
ncbi:hypothetical protein ABIF62_007464 [Bradyrhizobium japonicum]